MGAIQIEKGPVFSFLKNQRGQSIVEYSLLLLITIAIATAAGVRLFKPASQWVDFYLGTYTQCLLDSGELPKMAGGNPQECEDLPGNPNGPGGANDPNNPNNKSAQNGQDPNAANALGKAGTQGGGGSHGRGSRNYRRGGRSYSTDQAGIGGGGSDSAGNGESNSGKEKVRLVGSATRSGAFMGGGQRRSRYVGIAGLVDEEKKRIQRREERISKAGEVEAPDFRTQKKLTLKPPERKIAVDDQEIEGFSFGGLLRMIIIGGIIILTIVIIGTQLNSISKSMDK